MDQSGPSIFLSIRDALTPTVLFLLLNLIIATIVLSSKTRRHHGPDPNPRPGPTGLERVQSIGLFRFGSRDLTRPEPDTTQIHHQTAHRPEPDNTQIHHQNPILERVRSINLFRFGSRELPKPETREPEIREPEIREPEIREPETHEPETEHDDMDHHFRRIQSDSARPKPVMAEQGGKLRKLASALSWRAAEPETIRRRAPPAREVVAVEEEEVDARADDFINRFRQQLHLQRLDSIVRYKDMLTRGSRK